MRNNVAALAPTTNPLLGSLVATTRILRLTGWRRSGMIIVRNTKKEGDLMERDYLEWINKAYRILVENQDIPKMEFKLCDGKISVYRVGDVIRIDIKRAETKRG